MIFLSWVGYHSSPGLSPAKLDAQMLVIRKLWNDEDGIVALEYLLVATIVGLGLIAGLVGLRQSIDAELLELGNAALAINQGYSFSAVTACIASVQGSQATDTSATISMTFSEPSDVLLIDVNACSP
jgi:Flp pilus assembly pilin Flp